MPVGSTVPLNADDRYFVENYLVCYLDLMGTSDRLDRVRGVEFDPTSPSDIQRMVAAFSPTYNFRRACSKIIDAARENVLNPPAFLPGAEQLRAATRATIQSHCFGDTVILFTKLGHETGAQPVSAVWLIFKAIALLSREALAVQLPMRGAIEVGLAADVFDSECFGPVLADAHLLEKEANWPRVLVGTAATKYLEDLRNDTAPGPLAMAHRYCGAECAKMCLRWTDKKVMVDTWGMGESRDELEEVGKKRDLFQRAMTWVESQTSHPKVEIAEKYCELRAYMTSRKRHWE